MDPGMIGKLRGANARPGIRSPWEISRSGWVRTVEQDPKQFGAAMTDLGVDPFTVTYLSELTEKITERQVEMIGALADPVNNDQIYHYLATQLFEVALGADYSARPPDQYFSIVRESLAALGSKRTPEMVTAVVEYRQQMEGVFFSDDPPPEGNESALYGLIVAEELLLGGPLHLAFHQLQRSLEAGQAEYDSEKHWRQALEAFRPGS